MWNFFDIAVFVAGYAASIYSWPWIRTKVTGVTAEIGSLEAKATALRVSVGAPVVAQPPAQPPTAS